MDGQGLEAAGKLAVAWQRRKQGGGKKSTATARFLDSTVPAQSPPFKATMAGIRRGFASRFEWNRAMEEMGKGELGNQIQF